MLGWWRWRWLLPLLLLLLWGRLGIMVAELEPGGSRNYCSRKKAHNGIVGASGEKYSVIFFTKFSKLPTA